jgi:glutamate-1-semialdehyde 2,1-aminomutase
MIKFDKSNALFKNVIKYIPLASQTFSKSYKFLPKNHSPLFLDRGKGCYVFDYDENKYIDLISGLLSISIGYGVKEIDRAVIKQIKKGVNFSLPNSIEYILAKKIIQLIPCAEMVKFSKNGSDATTGAIRLARAVTKRDIILFCGYHGWHDWYIGKTTFNAGIPKKISSLSKNFKFNNIKSFNQVFNKYKKKVAAVIIEPMSFVEPDIKFLKKIKSECKKNKTILIFDETCTGFRFSLGGAQKFFGIIPDLATFGKGVANGYPLSILTGKKKIMKHCDKIFFSSTFGGEAVSLVAANETIKFIKKKSVIRHLFRMGTYLKNEMDIIIKKFNLNFVELKGHPSWTCFFFKDYNKYNKNIIKTFFIQKAIENGILTLGTNNINFSHKLNDIKKIIIIYKKIFLELQNKMNANKKLINYKEIKPLFQVRK